MLNEKHLEIFKTYVSNYEEVLNNWNDTKRKFYNIDYLNNLLYEIDKVSNFYDYEIMLVSAFLSRGVFHLPFEKNNLSKISTYVFKSDIKEREKISRCLKSLLIPNADNNILGILDEKIHCDLELEILIQNGIKRFKEFQSLSFQDFLLIEKNYFEKIKHKYQYIGNYLSWLDSWEPKIGIFIEENFNVFNQHIFEKSSLIFDKVIWLSTKPLQSEKIKFYQNDQYQTLKDYLKNQFNDITLVLGANIFNFNDQIKHFYTLKEAYNIKTVIILPDIEYSHK